ncbi:VC2662 family protein [Vibrio gallicus]|uniref:VC2662 family protein n=1 Tax=Vibrio gallicus TaxID=190897 RepID=UPI0021C2ED54|nr:phaC PHA synthase [Vibrio gallicus]
MKKRLIAVATTVAALTSPLAMADSTPVMFSSVNGFNAPNASSVGGVRLSVLHGKVSEVKGLDISVLGMSERDRMTGVNIGLFFGGSKVNQQMTGAAFGLFNWNPGNTTGANISAVNITNNVKGLNFGLANYSEGKTSADVAFASISKSSTFQLGIFNMTDKIEGVQIGLINCADNGFLKCFPIVNFAK